MSIQHMTTVIRAGGIRPTDKYVLLMLANYSDAHGYCWPGEKRIASDTGLSRASVQRAKANLVAAGLIKSIRRKDRKTREPISNLTRINLPLLERMQRPREEWSDDDLVGRITFPDGGCDAPDSGMTQDESKGGRTQDESQSASSCVIPGLILSHGWPQNESLTVSDAVSDPSALPLRESEKTEINDTTAQQARDLARWVTDSLGCVLGKKSRETIEANVAKAVAGGLPPSKALEYLTSRVHDGVHSPDRLHASNSSDLPAPGDGDADRWVQEMCDRCDLHGIPDDPDRHASKDPTVYPRRCLHGASDPWDDPDYRREREARLKDSNEQGVGVMQEQIKRRVAQQRRRGIKCVCEVDRHCDPCKRAEKAKSG